MTVGGITLAIDHSGKSIPGTMKAPAPGRGGLVTDGSVGRVPDEGIGSVVVLA